MDIYMLRGQEEKIEDLKLQLQEINNDLLSVEDAEELEERRANLEQLYNLKIEVNRLAGSKDKRSDGCIWRTTSKDRSTNFRW